ncbi:MAG: hypothetical protein MR265_05860 [Erysipelotrichaceae bacterium]|nr:hypothetical protein [Erysipelotrichaceae bacterium]
MIDEMQLTVQVNMSFQELDQVLTSKGLRKLNQKYQKDIFMIKNDENIDALADFEKLSHSIIIRDVENEFKGYLYKKSTYDIMTSSLKKQSIRVDLIDLEQGYHFLEALDYHKFLELNQDLIEYANATNKICVSIINGLGVFVEIHSRHMNYFNGNTPSELRRILDYYVPNIMNNDYYVNKAMLMINKK